MSHAGKIIGVSGLEVERVVRGEGIKVYARPRKRPACIHSRYRGVRIKATSERTLKHTRQGNQVMTLYLTSPK